PDGNGKLSKRDGDKLGFPVFPLKWENKENGETAAGFREQGYLSDAFLNFLSLLGWNPGNDREIFSLEEMIEAFSIERIGKSGTKFDIAKAKWFNEQYLKAKSNAELAHYVISGAEAEGITILQDTAEAIVALNKERVTFPAEIWQGSRFVVVAPTEFDETIASKRWNSDAVTILTAYA